MLSSVLIQLIVMISAARLLHSLARQLGQPGVNGEIVAGLLLGPSLFGHLFPHAETALFGHTPALPITIISQVGLILLMFEIGTEFAFGQLRSGRFAAATISVAFASVIVPFIAGFGFGHFSAASLAHGINPMVYSLFCGVAVAITAVPILGRILREFGLTRDPVGVIAISAAAINDVTGWLLLAGVSAYATMRFSFAFIGWRIGALVIGILVLRLIMWPLVGFLLRKFPPRSGHLHPNLMAFVICLVFALGLYTNRIEIFTIFGGFAAGLLFHRNENFVEAWRQQVGQFVLVFFLPVFFTFTGLRTNLFGLSTADFGWLGFLCAVAIFGKIVPVYFAGRLSGFSHLQSALLGSLMNTRGLMELIVLNVGFDLGFLPQKVFTMLVFMAVVTTITTGPIIQVLLARMEHQAIRVSA